jgi:predicted murein hydrolase (TIGR00659 family)
MQGLFHLWVYLETTPLLGLAATLLVYRGALELARLFRGHALANPVLIAILALALLLEATGTPYAAYFQGAQYVHFLLGPATVALAVPMHANLRRIRASARAILPAILAGSLVAAASAMVLARLLGAPRAVVLSLAPKSVTTPIAMGVAEQIGGQPSLAAVFVLITGLVAGVLVGPALRLIRVTDWRAQGLAAGTAGHGLATARMLLVSETAGAFGGLAIGLNGVITAILVPLLAGLLAGR